MIKQSETYILSATVIIATAVFSFWLLHDPATDLEISVPGMDGRPEVDENAVEVVTIGEKFTEYRKESSGLMGSWPRFRGRNFDNISREGPELIDSWENDDPQILWSVNLGEGHAAPVIHKGKVFILDYHEIKKADQLRCFSLETGEELWRRWYNVHIKRNHGISRTVPAVNEKYLVTIGPLGHVMCTEPETGEFLWGLDLVKSYNAEIPFWYTGQCPLLIDNLVVLAPGGDALMIGVDCATGEVLWETKNPDQWKMSHSSIMPMSFAGKEMYVYAAIGGIAGVSASGQDIGKIVWKSDQFAPSVVAPSPVILDHGKIFISAGYGAGSMLFKLNPQGDQFTVEVLQKYKPKDGLACEQQTPIYFDGHLFSVLPKDAGGERNQFVCSSPDDCTEFIWTSGKSNRYGLGPYIIADNKFFILNDDGTLTIARATATGFFKLDEKQIFEGQDAWGPLAIADGRLLLRDSKKMFCVDMKKNSNHL